MDVARGPHILRARQECAGCVCQTAHMPRMQKTFVRRCGTALPTEGTSVVLSSVVDTIYLVTTPQRKTSVVSSIRPVVDSLIMLAVPSLLHNVCPVYGVDAPLASSSRSNTDALVCFANAVRCRRQGRDSAQKMKSNARLRRRTGPQHHQRRGCCSRARLFFFRLCVACKPRWLPCHLSPFPSPSPPRCK